MSFAVDALRESAVFAGASLETLDAVAGAMEHRLLLGGERLFAQGDPGDAAYVVLSGRVRVEREEAGRTLTVREAGRGELIGEFTMLTGAPRTASVRAVRQCELGRIPRDKFEALVKRHPSLAIGMGRNLARLLGEAPPTPRPRPMATVIGVRPVVAGQSIVRVGEGLAVALRAVGRCALVTGAEAEAALGAELRGRSDAEASLAIARWLQQVESAHDYVVCVTDGTYPAWDAASIQQSDLLLDLLDATSSLPPDRAAPEPTVSCSRELVVVHAGAYRRPTIASRYVAAGRYGHWHHVRMGESTDFDRLARHLTGRRIGFVLGGGGARGLAHIGFLRAAQELGIPIDEIGGTSIGALVSAQWASGATIEEMIDAHHAGWPRQAYTLPLIGLVRANAMERMLLPMLGELDYADCWIEAFACSCNLTNPGITVHRRGRVIDACMASMAIPGLGPAMTMPDRTLHVDGSLVSNLPAKQLRSGVVIASDVSSASPRDSGYPRTPSTWEVVRDRMLPPTKRPYYPSLYSTVVQATLVGSVREAARVSETADLYFRAPVEHIGLFEFGRLDEAVAVGYRAGMDVLRPWWESRAGK
jgi:NTE family protein